jgi:hypothetical protein
VKKTRFQNLAFFQIQLAPLYSLVKDKHKIPCITVGVGLCKLNAVDP